MIHLVIRSWCLLLYMEYVMQRRTFKDLHRLVRQEPLQRQPSSSSQETLSRAMDLACVFYFKRVLCLQRSSALTLLLRRHGWYAEMVVGVQMVPFRSHAWCEVNGIVVNDKPYVPEIYQILERC
jgi:hypothetical protein